MNRIRVATVFSGIGSVEFALKRLGVEHEIVFACDNGERDDVEIDYENEFANVRQLDSIDEKQRYVNNLYGKITKKKNYVQQSYLANYKCPRNRFFQDIKLLDGKDFRGKVDLLVGGSPCQSFSSVGFQGGLSDARGTLFYDFARLVLEIEPAVFIYENVKNMLSHDGGKTWKVISSVFENLGYNIDYKILNALDFNIPQKRNRLFVVGFLKSKNKYPVIKEKGNVYPCQYVMQDFLLSNTAYGDFRFKLDGSLSLEHSNSTTVDERYYLSDAVRRYVLKGGTKTWFQKPEIDLPIARTLLKTMGNCHRAGVDNYVTEKGRIRMLTEREALRLMGYTDDFKIVVSISQMYKQAGNSIVVDVMMSILSTIFKTGIFNEEKNYE